MARTAAAEGRGVGSQRQQNDQQGIFVGVHYTDVPTKCGSGRGKGPQT